MKHIPGLACVALLALGCAGAGSADAQTADIKTIVSIGGPPVVLNQNSQLNAAGVFMIGGSTSATVVQNGTNNATRNPAIRRNEFGLGRAGGREQYCLRRPDRPVGDEPRVPARHDEHGDHRAIRRGELIDGDPEKSVRDATSPSSGVKC